MLDHFCIQANRW